MPTKVSIIIPAFNVQNYLPSCLDSVLQQNYPYFEVVVVNNGSTDNTEKIIRDYQACDPRVKYVFEPRRSRGAARNAGIREATGEIVAMVDSDCIVEPRWLECLIEPIWEDGEVIVMGWEDSLIRNACTDFIQKQNKEFLDQYREGEYISTLDTKNCAFRSEVIRENGFDGEIGNLEDFELALRLRGKYKIRFLEGVRVRHYHKVSAGSWMKLQFNRGFWARQIYKKHKNSPIIRDEVMFRSLQPLNMLSFPFWMAYQFLKNPSRRVWLMFVSELGWRMGLVFGRNKIVHV